MPLALQAALLGIVQGITEFLPVSSSAHLILARLFLGFDGDKFGLSFDVACHVGTLIAVLIYFRTELRRLIAALPRLFDLKDPEARLIWLLAIGTIPAIIVGLLFKHRIDAALAQGAQQKIRGVERIAQQQVSALQGIEDQIGRAHV